VLHDRLCGDEFEDRGAGLESLSRFKLLNSSDVRGGERNIGCQRRWKYLDKEMVLRQPDIGRGYRRTEHVSFSLVGGLEREQRS
jgi:hypothetical protein